MIDKNVYLEILTNHLLPWATEHYENGHWILHRNGAFAHLAKSTQYWCLANLPDASEWPANSPELNVLDFSIWTTLEQKACQKKTHQLSGSVEVYGGSPERNPARLRARRGGGIS
ncbi:hypothetical protein ANCDUO_25992 [Ancylostoma duodenale]|uniref:Uncharacterized protein n=1 Tax=Ancylostoma duodenale TaxID=51022 RepID=A0A0C2FB27_9BILA|nr:hypothetical protein ANCDUO_25992 [Ancylostoma duodenale]